MKGGHGLSGPPRDPQALRRDRTPDGSTWTHLPAIGRQGEPPEWPLSRPTRRELQLWQAEWRRPQAVMWEANGQQVEVALYVRCLAEAEHLRARVTLRVLVRQQMEALGISAIGLARLRWVIATAGNAERPRVVADAAASAKERLRRA